MQYLCGKLKNKQKGDVILMNWKINQIAERISDYYLSNHYASKVYENKEEHKPVLLLGQSGTGKTEGVGQAAKAVAERMEYDYIDFSQFSRLSPSEKDQALSGNPFIFVDFNLLTHDPIDFSGKPIETTQMINTEEASFSVEVTEFVPMSWASLLRYYPGMIFIDEITNVSRNDLRAVALKLVGERKTGYCQLHDGVMIVMAGNKPEHSSLAMNLPAPLINRAVVINTYPAVAEEWLEYMKSKYRENLDYPVAGYLSYLAATPVNPNEDVMEGFHSPRSCESLLRHIQTMKIAVKNNIISHQSLKDGILDAPGFIGPVEGQMFVAWYNNYSMLEDLFSNPSETEVISKMKKMKASELCAIGTMLGREIHSAFEAKMMPKNLSNISHILKGLSSIGKDYINIAFIAADIFSRSVNDMEGIMKSLSMLVFAKDIANDTVKTKAYYNQYSKLSPDIVLDFMCHRRPEEMPNYKSDNHVLEHPFLIPDDAKESVKDLVSVAAVMINKQTITQVINEICTDPKLMRKVASV